MVRQGSAAVDFQGDFEGFPAFRVPADGLIGNILVRMSHPVTPAGAEDLSVDVEDGFTAGIQVHDDPLPAGLLRHGETAEHPGIIPGHAPGGSGRPGLPGIGFRFPQVQDGRRRKALQGNFAQRVIKICCQRVNHVPKLIGDFLIHLSSSFEMILCAEGRTLYDRFIHISDMMILHRRCGRQGEQNKITENQARKEKIPGLM